ncbi:uncharacterized protein LOC134791207 [Cydia splendana]|uniref:uncharacterized protein LOC134791207 n=1 Tax=Cydia splendana TaxID=1100963 RepID=UPI0028F488D6
MERAVVRSSARLSGGGGGPSKSGGGGDKASSRAEAARRAAAAALAAERRARARQRAEEVEDSPSVLRDKCRELARVVRQAKHLVVYTGAGISTAADIPDYRGPHGVWTRLQRGEDIGRVEVSRAQPTFTHMALAALVARGLCKFVVSQNCDGLHVRSGLPRRSLAELHGDMFAERCAAPRCRAVLLRAFDTTQRTRRYSHGTRRTCPVPRCGRPLRDTIVHFGERARAAWPLNWAGALRHAAAADVILCLGSSLKVLRRYPRLWCMARPARARPRLYIVNLQWTPKDTAAELKINARCDSVMRELARRLRVRVPRYRRSRDPLLAHATPLAPAERHTCSRPVLAEPEPEPEPDDSASSEPSEFDSSSASDSDDALPLRRLQERLRGSRPRANGPSSPVARADGPRGPVARLNGPSGPGARLDGPSGPGARLDGPSGPGARLDGPRCQRGPPDRLRDLQFPERPRPLSQMEGLREAPRPVPGLKRLQRPAERSSDSNFPVEGLRPRSPTPRLRDRQYPAERLRNLETSANYQRGRNVPETDLRRPQFPEERLRDRQPLLDRLQNRECPADGLRDPQFLAERLRGPRSPTERLRSPDTLADRLRDPEMLEPEEKKPKLENGICAVVKEEHLRSFEVSLADGSARILLHAAHAPEPKEEEDEGGGLGLPRSRPPRPRDRSAGLLKLGPKPAVKEEDSESEASRAAAAFIARAVFMCRGKLYSGLHTILGPAPAPEPAGACGWCWRRLGSRRCLWYPARDPRAAGRVWRRVRGRRYLCTCCPRDGADASSADEGGEGGWYGKGYRKGRKKKR